MIKTKGKYLLILSLILLASTNYIGAQNININSYLDTNSILIGDQIKYHLEITQDKEIDIVLPYFTDTIVDKVEIIAQSPADTTYLSADILKISKEFTITSFDSGFYVLPAIAIPYAQNNILDTILSEPLVLGVYTFEIDTVRGISDIKAPIETPVTFKEVLPWIVYGVITIIAILVLIWLYFKYFKKEPIIIKRVIPEEPAHIIALRDFDKLKTMKLWQQGKPKEYHSVLTEVLRTYIENRFEIQAMELTSDEVLETFKGKVLLKSDSFEKLEHILITADLVKFAKFQPLPDQHDLSLEYAYEIILNSKLKEDLSKKKESIDEITKSNIIVENNIAPELINNNSKES